MSQSFTSDSLQRLFSYPFQDPRWKEKLAVAAALSLAGMVIPIIPSLFVYGYAARIVRHVIRNGEPILPDWEDWGELLVEGLRLFGVGLVYALPLILVMIAAFGLVSVVSWLPLMLGPEAVSETGAMAGFFLSWAGGMALFGVAALLSLLTGLILPAPLAHVVATGRFKAAFQFREWWPIFRANLVGFLVSYAILIGVSFVLGIVAQILYMTLILCCLIPFVSAAISGYTTVVGSALFAQAYRAGVEQLARATGTMPTD